MPGPSPASYFGDHAPALDPQDGALRLTLFADLERDHRDPLERGVSNPVALRHLRSMAPGDPVMIYHTGDEKRIVGLARVAGAPYPDPDGETSASRSWMSRRVPPSRRR